MQDIAQLWQSALPEIEQHTPFDTQQFRQLLHCALTSDALDYKELQDLLAQYPGDDLKSEFNSSDNDDNNFLKIAIEYFISRPFKNKNDLMLAGLKLMLLFKHGANISDDIREIIINHSSPTHQLCLFEVLLSIQLQFPFYLMSVNNMSKVCDCSATPITLELNGIFHQNIDAYLRGTAPLIREIYPDLLKQLTLKRDVTPSNFAVTFTINNDSQRIDMLRKLLYHWPELMEAQQQRFIKDFSATRQQLDDMKTDNIYQEFIALGMPVTYGTNKRRLLEVHNYFPNIYNNMLLLFDQPIFLQSQQEVFRWFVENFLPALEFAYHVSCQSMIGLTSLVADFIPRIIEDIAIKTSSHFITFPLKHERLCSFLFVQAYVHQQYRVVFEKDPAVVNFDGQLALRELIKCQGKYTDNQFVQLHLAVINVKLLLIQNDKSSALSNSIKDFSEQLQHFSITKSTDKEYQTQLITLLTFHLNNFHRQLASYAKNRSVEFNELILYLCENIIEKLKIYSKSKKLTFTDNPVHKSTVSNTANALKGEYQKTCSNITKVISKKRAQEHQLAQQLTKAKIIEKKCLVQGVKAVETQAAAQPCEPVTTRVATTSHELSDEKFSAASANELKATEQSDSDLAASAAINTSDAAFFPRTISEEQQLIEKAAKRQAFLKKHQSARNVDIQENTAATIPAQKKYPISGITMHRPMFVTFTAEAQKHCTDEQLQGTKAFLEKNPKLCVRGFGVKFVARSERERKGLPTNATYKIKFMLHGQQARVYCREARSDQGVELQVCAAAIFGKKVHR